MVDETDDVDWSLATWEGSQREKLRRWAKLPLESIIAALEEMQELNEALHSSAITPTQSHNTDAVQESPGDYGPDVKHVSPGNKK